MKTHDVGIAGIGIAGISKMSILPAVSSVQKGLDTSRAQRTNSTASCTTNFMAKWTQTQKKIKN